MIVTRRCFLLAICISSFLLVLGQKSNLSLIECDSSINSYDFDLLSLRPIGAVHKKSTITTCFKSGKMKVIFDEQGISGEYNIERNDDHILLTMVGKTWGIFNTAYLNDTILVSESLIVVQRRLFTPSGNLMKIDLNILEYDRKDLTAVFLNIDPGNDFSIKNFIPSLLNKYTAEIKVKSAHTNNVIQLNMLDNVIYFEKKSLFKHLYSGLLDFQ